MRRYHYVGPEHVRAAASDAPPGTPIDSRAALARWLAEHVTEREGVTTPATYVVTPDGVLRVASRRSEHVACAGGQAVLAAGELFLDGRGVVEASNLSTGYCPEPACWDALAAALDRAGLDRPAALSYAFDFRRCEACGERNLIKDEQLVCAICDADLPARWNF